jgi:hypothetical protein
VRHGGGTWWLHMCEVTLRRRLSSPTNNPDQPESFGVTLHATRTPGEQVRNHIEQELLSTLLTLWEEPDERLVAHVHALNILSETRASIDESAREVLEVIDGVASAVLDHGVATLEKKLSSWEAAQDDWELWRVDPCVINPRHPVSQALWIVHNGACTAMLQFAALNQVAQRSCNVTLENVHERCAPVNAGDFNHEEPTQQTDQKAELLS